MRLVPVVLWWRGEMYDWQDCTNFRNVSCRPRLRPSVPSVPSGEREPGSCYRRRRRRGLCFISYLFNDPDLPEPPCSLRPSPLRNELSVQCIAQRDEPVFWGGAQLSFWQALLGFYFLYSLLRWIRRRHGTFALYLKKKRFDITCDSHPP